MSGKAKITGYDELAAADLAAGDMIEIVDVSESAAADKNKKFALRGLRPYKVYVGLLTQSSTNAPTAVVLENTLGGIPVLTYNIAGGYVVTLAGVFTLNKTFIILGTTPHNQGSATSMVVACPNESLTLDSFEISTIDNIGAQANNLLENTPIEIRVYD